MAASPQSEQAELGVRQGGRGPTLAIRRNSLESVGLWSCVSASALPRRDATQRLSPALATHRSCPFTSATTCHNSAIWSSQNQGHKELTHAVATSAKSNKKFRYKGIS